MMRTMWLSVTVLSAFLALNAPVFACGEGDDCGGDKEKAAAQPVTHLSLPLAGIDEAGDNELILAALGKAFKVESCDKGDACCSEAKAASFAIDEKGTLEIDLPRRATLSLTALQAALAETGAQLGEIAVGPTVLVKLSGVTCGGCASHLTGSLGEVDAIADVRVRPEGEGIGWARITVVSGKTLTLATLKESCGQKFQVEDVIWDGRCAGCTGFKAEEKAGCGGCAKGGETGGCAKGAGAGAGCAGS